MSTDRPATTDPAEVAPVHTGGNAEDCPACDGRSDLPYPWICPGKDLTASGREPAVRASEAPGGAHSPTPDAGAVRGGEGGSAAESEPRPVDLAFAALGKWFHGPGYTAAGHAKDPDDCGMCWEAAEKATEAVIPAIRAQVADEIEATIGGYPENEAVRPKAERGGYLNDADWAAAIARGDQ